MKLFQTKSITLITFILLAAISCKTQSKKNDKNDLLGNVRQVVTSQFKPVEIGGVITEGKITSENVSVFNDKNKLIENKIEFLDGTGRVITNTFKYDNTGNQIEKVTYDSYFRSTHKVVYKYDNKNNILEEIEYDSLSRADYKEKYTNHYDNFGNLIEQTSQDNYRTTKNTYKYDEKGNWINYECKSSDGIYAFQETANYDENGNIIEMKTYDGNGNITNRSVYKYDKYGNEIEITSYDSNGQPQQQVFKYEYDSKDNWTKRIEFKSGKAIEIIQKRIQYR
jgi:hypothetical protein